jgi:hypothetical protein
MRVDVGGAGYPAESWPAPSTMHSFVSFSMHIAAYQQTSCSGMARIVTTRNASAMKTPSPSVHQHPRQTREHVYAELHLQAEPTKTDSAP